MMKNKFFSKLSSLAAIAIVGGGILAGCSGSGQRTPIQILSDSLTESGDSIIMQIDSTALVYIHPEGDNNLLILTKLGEEGSLPMARLGDFKMVGDTIVYISGEEGQMLAARFIPSTLSSDTIKVAEKVKFTPARDSIEFTNAGKKILSDLKGTFAVEREPGVCDAVKKESIRANNYTDNSAGYWSVFKKKPITFLGQQGKLSLWQGGKFACMIEMPDGVIAVKKNGDAYLNDEKIGVINVRTSNRSNGMGFVTYTTTGEYAGIDGTTDTFRASTKMFIP